MQYSIVIWFTGFRLSGLAECYLCVCSDAQSCLTLCDPMVCSLQASLPMGFSRQEYWSGVPFPPPSDLPDSGTESMSLVTSALAVGFFTWEAPC